MTPDRQDFMTKDRSERIAQLNQHCVSHLTRIHERWFKLSDQWLQQAATQQQDPQAQQHYFSARQTLHRHKHRLQQQWQAESTQQLDSFWHSAAATTGLDAWEDHAWRPTLENIIRACEARSPARLSQIQYGLNRLLQRQQTLAQLPFAPTVLVCRFASQLASLALADDLHVPLLGKWEAAMQSHLGDVLGTIQQFLESEQNHNRAYRVMPANASQALRFSHLQALLSLKGQRPAPLGSRHAGKQLTQSLTRDVLLSYVDRFQHIQWEAHAGDPVLTTTLSVQDFRFWLQQELTAQESTQGPQQLKQVDDDLLTLCEQWVNGFNSDWLPQQVRSVLLRLQVVLLKALLLDQAVFTEPTHPVRNCLDTCAQAAVGWMPAQTLTGDPVLAVLQQAVARLLRDFQRDMTCFRETAQWVSQSLSGEQQRRNRLAQRTLNNEAGRLRLERGQQFVDGMLRERIEGRALPAIGEILVEGPWRQALLRILLKQGCDDPAWETALITTDQLIGSLQEPSLSESLSDAERTAWIRRLPGMVRRLSNELEALQCTQQRIGKITLALWQYHAERFQLRAEDLRQVPRDERPLPVNAAWIAKTLQASREQFNPSANNPLSDLNPGDWVLLERGKAQHCVQVAGYLPETASYLFVDYMGSKRAHLSRPQIASLKKQQRFGLLQPEPLTEQALQHLKHWLTADDKPTMTTTV